MKKLLQQKSVVFELPTETVSDQTDSQAVVVIVHFAGSSSQNTSTADHHKNGEQY